ncbi:polysaccharide biosynthesis tyrosine autokinase [Streptomyces sp. TRM66268-LWL]|uniref:Polysaccharide biosynthesis tyrosine autokinase n=1 Tax=Streptomyces polyasparticus TaxID=2767826 RepID=A0ABR7SHW3_9ACTN|nr:polysaccharide biosynthesis tyrosine autokinase [Streptomyces polyasparticus]MBC9714429.1 polysaccharide biosynthesis tyrosine autokinase [Streptomyces polyasparticus]
MDLRGFLKIIARRWPLATAVLLLGIAAGWTVTAVTTPVYEARTQLFVATHSAEGDTTQLNQGQNFSQARVQSYAAIVATDQVTEPVVRDLDLDTTPRALASRITAEAPLNTVLINIRVADTDPRRAAAVADEVAERFAKVVEELETPAGARTAPVRLGITEHAAVPSVPVAPNALLNLAAGLLAGVLGGIALVVLLETLDTTFKHHTALAELTGLPVLGIIPFDKEAPEHPLVNAVPGHSPRAEAFRRLRTNLQFAQVDERPKVLVVSSSMPGEGKTNTAANLALSLAEAGIRTCLVDADLRRPCVARTFGLVQDAGLTTVLIGRAGLDDVMQEGPGGLSVLTSGAVPPNPTELLASARMAETLKDLAGRYEAVVVDTAPLLPVADTVGLAPLAQGALLVVRASKTSREQVRMATEALRTVGVRTLGTVFSVVPTAKSKGYGTYGSYEPRSEEKGRHRMPVPRTNRAREGVALSYLAGDK